MPVASTPTTRRVRVARSAAAIPTSETISCVASPVTGVRRRIGQRAAIRTSARSARWRSTMWRAMCSASSSTSSASPITTSSIASSNSSGKRDMWTPFWPRVEVDGAVDLRGHDRLGRSPRRRRIAFVTPVTPARVRAERAPRAPRPGDRREQVGVAHAVTLATSCRPTSPASSRSRATTCARRSRPCRGSRRRCCASTPSPSSASALPRHDRRARRASSSG